MRQDDGASIGVQRGPHHFPRVDAGAIDSAGEQPLAVEDAVTVVEPQHVELLVEQRAEPHAQEVDGVVGFHDVAVPLEPCVQDGFGGGQDGLLPALPGRGRGAAAKVAGNGMTDSLYRRAPTQEARLAPGSLRWGGER